MNSRRKKISMKEQLEEAIKEIGGEPLQAQASSLRPRKKGYARFRAKNFASPPPKSHFDSQRT